MTTVVLDAATCQKLMTAEGQVVQLRDEMGKLVGEFVKELVPDDYELARPMASEEEIERRRRESPTYTAAQVEDRLRRLRKCE